MLWTVPSTNLSNRVSDCSMSNSPIPPYFHLLVMGISTQLLMKLCQLSNFIDITLFIYCSLGWYSHRICSIVKGLFSVKMLLTLTSISSFKKHLKPLPHEEHCFDDPNKIKLYDHLLVRGCQDKQSVPQKLPIEILSGFFIWREIMACLSLSNFLSPLVKMIMTYLLLFSEPPSFPRMSLSLSTLQKTHRHYKMPMMFLELSMYFSNSEK